MKRARLGEMRLLERRSNSSAQALLELAIFSSIILFCLGLLLQYGLRSNYQQFLQMTTFRRALTLAVNRSQNNVTNRYSPSVGLTVVWDKSIPNPQDQFGIQEHFPYAVGAGVVYSNKLQATLTSIQGSDDDRQYLPGTDIIINEGDQWGPGGTHREGNPGWLHPANLTFKYDSAAGFTGMDTQVGYTTQGFGKLEDPCAADKVYRKKRANYDPANPDRVWWEWKEGITCETKDEDGEKYVQVGATLDVDDDYVEETLVAEDVVCQTVANDEELGQPILKCELVGYFTLDPNLGEIDPSYGKVTEVVLNGKPTKVVRPITDEQGLEVHQGLQQAYLNKLQQVYGREGGELNTHSVRAETPTGITNSWGAKATETLRRQVLLNDKSRNDELPENLIKTEARSVFNQEKNRVWQTDF